MGQRSGHLLAADETLSVEDKTVRVGLLVAWFGGILGVYRGYIGGTLGVYVGVHRVDLLAADETLSVEYSARGVVMYTGTL